MSFGTWWMEPLNSSNPDDVIAAERALQFFVGWFAHPIYGAGDYPAAMKEAVARKSREQDLNSSRLPELTEEEIAYIKGEETKTSHADMIARNGGLYVLYLRHRDIISPSYPRLMIRSNDDDCNRLTA